MTIQVVPNLPLTSKQTFVLMSTGTWELPEWSPCIYLSTYKSIEAKTTRRGGGGADNGGGGNKCFSPFSVAPISAFPRALPSGSLHIGRE